MSRPEFSHSMAFFSSSDSLIPRTFWALLVLVLFGAGCNGSQPKAIPMEGQELEEFGHQLKYAFDEKDKAFFERSSDGYRILGRMIQMGLIEEPSADFGKSFADEYSLAEYFLEESLGDEWTYLHVKGLVNSQNQELLRVRLSDDNLRFSFYDMLVENRVFEGDTIPIVVDLYFPLVDGWLSEVFAELVQENKEEGDDFSVRYADMVVAFNDLDYEKGMAFYETMSQEQQNRKSLLMLRYNSALTIDPLVAEEIRDKFEELYPDDLRLIVHDMDKYLWNEEFVLFLGTLEQMERVIDSEDALLLTYKGIGELNLGNYEQSEKWFGFAIAVEPDFYPAYLQSMFVLAFVGQHAEAVERGQALERFGYKLSDFDWEETPEFTESEAYLDWENGGNNAGNQ